MQCSTLWSSWHCTCIPLVDLSITFPRLAPPCILWKYGYGGHEISQPGSKRQAEPRRGLTTGRADPLQLIDVNRGAWVPAVSAAIATKVDVPMALGHRTMSHPCRSVAGLPSTADCRRRQ